MTKPIEMIESLLLTKTLCDGADEKFRMGFDSTCDDVVAVLGAFLRVNRLTTKEHSNIVKQTGYDK